MTDPATEAAQRERAMGERLADARAAAGLSIRRAAKVAGLPATLWADLERGERSTPGVRVGADDAVIAAAARAVDVDPAELLAALGREVSATVTPRLSPLEQRLRRIESAIELLAERAGIEADELWGPRGPGR
jgi:transcriptional regulator with XRE-family HTH domain